MNVMTFDKTVITAIKRSKRETEGFTYEKRKEEENPKMILEPSEATSQAEHSRRYST